MWCEQSISPHIDWKDDSFFQLPLPLGLDSLQSVSGPYRIVYSLYRIPMTSHTFFIRYMSDRIQSVSDPDEIAYSLYQIHVGLYKVCIGYP